MTRPLRVRDKAEAVLFYGICSNSGFESEGEIAVKLGWTNGNDVSEPENSEYNIQQDVKSNLNINGVGLDRAGNQRQHVPYFWAVRLSADGHAIIDASKLPDVSNRQKKLLTELANKLGWPPPGWKLASWG